MDPRPCSSQIHRDDPSASTSRTAMRRCKSRDTVKLPCSMAPRRPSSDQVLPSQTSIPKGSLEQKRQAMPEASSHKASAAQTLQADCPDAPQRSEEHTSE